MDTENNFYFNIPRLSEEIDKIFETKVSNTEKVLHNSFSGWMKSYKDECDSLKNSFKKEYEETITNVLSNARQELIDSLIAGRTIINIANNTTISISHNDHPQFEEVFKKLSIHKKVLLVGKAGTGKTYMAAQIAQKLGLPFYKYSCSRDSSVHDLMGYKQPRSEEYLETSFLKAYENGGVFLCDEFDAMDGSMSLFFNGVADSSDSISIPHRDSNPVAKKHKDFYLVMCGNTWGEGSIEYSGRDFQDKALLDRFRVSKLEIGYHTTLEKSLVQNLDTSPKLDHRSIKDVPDFYNFFFTLRQDLESVGSYLSTRNLEDIVTSLLSEERITEKTVKNVLEHLISDLTPNLKEKMVLEIEKNLLVYVKKA